MTRRPRAKAVRTARTARTARTGVGKGAPVVVDDIREAVSHLKRERIIAAAVELFYSNGFRNTTLDAVAERMNVTKPFIYSHFKSKGELLAEICARGIGASLEAINRVVESTATSAAKLAALTRDFMSAVLQNQKHIAIYTREEKNLDIGDSAAIRTMRREFERKLVKLLDDGVDGGEFDIADTRMAALAIGGIASWAYVWFRPGGRLTAEQIADHMAGLVLAMNKAGAGGARRRTKRILGKRGR